MAYLFLIVLIFQSTLPAREATVSSTQFITFSLFQSTLPAREATDKLADKLNVLAISIHPSREGSDPFLSRITVFLPPISIHASCGGSDRSSYAHLSTGRNFNPRFPRGKRQVYDQGPPRHPAFQSTLPAREATIPHGET